MYRSIPTQRSRLSKRPPPILAPSSCTGVGCTFFSPSLIEKSDHKSEVRLHFSLFCYLSFLAVISSCHLSRDCIMLKTYHTYTVQFKVSVVDWHLAHGENVSQTAREFEVERTGMHEWLVNADKLRQHCHSRQKRTRRLHSV